MVLRETLIDADIPGRDKMREAIISQWRNSFEGLKLDLSVGFSTCFLTLLTNTNQQCSCGRISFTVDGWSNANMASYLALTSHWISIDELSRRLMLKAALIGFHRLKQKHSGANIAKTILHLLDRANITLKVCLLFLIAHISTLS